MTWVGRSTKRREDGPLVRGFGRYVGDLAAGATFLRFVRSPVASATIGNIAIPDDVRAYTIDDLGDVAPIRPLLFRPDYIATEQYVLAKDRVRFVGEAIVAVLGSSPEEAEDDAERVTIDLHTTDCVTDVDAAVVPGAVRVHDQAAENTLVEANLRGDGLDDAFASAAEVVEIAIESGRQSAMPLEPRGGHAAFDRRTGRVTVHASVQTPHQVRTGVADCLGIEEALVRVIAPDVGGGFGQKMQLSPEYVVAAWLARLLRGKVVWVEDRHENLMASYHSRDQRYALRGAFDADARLTAIDADLRCNIGAYSTYPVTCGVEPLMAMGELPGPYDFRHYGVRSRGVATHTCPMAPYRGVSRPVITFAMERLMDTAARRFNIEPDEIRRRNLIRKFPYTSVTGTVYDQGSYVEALDKAVETIDLSSFRKRQYQARGEGRYLGIGFSTFNERTGYGTPTFSQRAMEITPGYETVEITMDPSGSIEARIGASPHGQGLATSLSQIIADETGVDVEKITIVHGDTDRTPYGWGTFASRAIVIAGGATKLAAVELAERITFLAAHLLQADPDDVTLEMGRAKAGSGSVDIATLARTAYHQSHQFPGEAYAKLSARASYDPVGTFANACHVVIVEVETDTGGVRLERYLTVEDAGRLINPMIADGQVRGGVAQGIGNALYEQIVYDDTGNIMTTSLADYLVPTAAEVPEIEIVHLETISDATITGAKGLGEGGAIGAPAAVINAVVDALQPFGVEVYEMPITPNRLRDLIRSAETKQ